MARLTPPPSEAPAAPRPVPQQGTPAFLAGDTRRANPMPRGQHPAFVLAHSQDAWTVEGGRLIPQLAKHVVQDGVNGTSVIRDGAGLVRGTDTSLFRANLHSWGQKEIPHDVDGPGTSYMVQPYPGHYVDRWTRMYPGTDRVSYDTAGYAAWCGSLVDRRVIQPPRLPALEALQQRLQAAHDGLATRVGSIPPGIVTDSSRELTRLAEGVAVVTSAIEALIASESEQ